MIPTDSEEILKFIKRTIESMESAPQMWACTKEAFSAQLRMLLDMYGWGGKHLPGFEKYVNKCSIPTSDLKEEITDEWAREAARRTKLFLFELYPEMIK